MHGLPNIIRQNPDEDDRNIHKVAMHVLHDQRKRTFTEISFARLANGACGRISPERFVIRASIIVAGQPKSAGRPENEQRGRKQKPTGPPNWFAAKPRVRRVSKNFRRIKRRNVITEKIIASLKR